MLLDLFEPLLPGVFFHRGLVLFLVMLIMLFFGLSFMALWHLALFLVMLII